VGGWVGEVRRFTDPSYGLTVCTRPSEGGEGQGDSGSCAKGDHSAAREISFHGVYRVPAASLGVAATARAGELRYAGWSTARGGGAGDEEPAAAAAAAGAELMLRGLSKPNGIGFSADGTRLFVSNTGGDPHVMVWPLRTGEPRPPLLLPHGPNERR
jgi:sugar lactone lactonase YvrE